MTSFQERHPGLKNALIKICDHWVQETCDCPFYVRSDEVDATQIDKEKVRAALLGIIEQDINGCVLRDRFRMAGELGIDLGLRL